VVARRLFIAFWILVLAIYLTHDIVLSSDSVNNHVHVWYIADDLWHHGRLPFAMPELAHGDAYAYPYGFLNWTSAALVWPLFGDWAVTLWTVIGVVGCIVATFFAFPELRTGWWTAAALANPALIEALLFGQQSFAWAAALLLLGIGLWRRGHRAWAAVLVGIGQATHPAVVLPIGIVVVLLYLPFTKDRWAVVRWYALSCAMAIPAALLVLMSPTITATSAYQRNLNFWITLGPRVLIVVLPLFYTVLRYKGRPAYAPTAVAISLAFNLMFHGWLNVQQQVDAVFDWGTNTASLDRYLDSPVFEKGATYRALRAEDGKLGLYKVLRAGGRLDSELFPESMAIESFDDVDEYARLLCDRDVEFVLHFDSYDEVRDTNERAMLDALAKDPDAPVGVERIADLGDGRVYAIDRTDCPAVPTAEHS
jgi:hypothetical protein